MAATSYRIVPSRSFGWIVQKWNDTSPRVRRLSGDPGSPKARAEAILDSVRWVGWFSVGWRPTRRLAERLVRKHRRAEQADAAWETYKREHTFIFGTGDEQ